MSRNIEFNYLFKLQAINFFPQEQRRRPLSRFRHFINVTQC